MLLDERIALLSNSITPDSICTTLAFLNEAFPDFGSQCEAARMLELTGKIGPLAAPDKPIETVAAYYYHLAGGGIETALRSLANDLGRDRRSIVITEDGPNEWTGDAGGSEKMAIENARIVSLGNAEGTNHFERLKSLLEREHIDVLIYHAWFERNLLWDIALCHACGVRVVLNVHGVFSHFLEVSDSQHNPWSDGRLFASVAHASRLCDAIVSQSDVNRQFYAHFNPRSYAIPHKLSEPYASLVNHARSYEAAPTVNLLWVGRFDPYKHPEDALDILARVRKQLPETTLTYVGRSGDGAYDEALRKKAVDLGIEDAVTFAGFHADVSPFFCEADIVISTTEVEGFCMILAEASACGTPVVAYDLPYLPFAQCEGIVWVPQGDTAAAASRICALVRDESSWLSASRACQTFMGSGLYEAFPTTWNNVITHLEQEPEAAEKNRIEAERVMWDTLLAHYICGEQRSHDIIEKNASEARCARNELDEIASSHSYKVGHALLTAPRLLKRMLDRR